MKFLLTFKATKALKRFRPSIAFPWDVVPPFVVRLGDVLRVPRLVLPARRTLLPEVTFWLTHRFAQAEGKGPFWKKDVALKSGQAAQMPQFGLQEFCGLSMISKYSECAVHFWA